MVVAKSKQTEGAFLSRLPSGIVRLTSIEHHVLSAIQFDGRVSVAEIAKLINSKESTVRYAIDTLREKQIIYFAPLIDLTRLGFTYYTILFSLTSEESRRIEKIREFIAQSTQVIFAREIGGKYQFAITFVACSAMEVNNFCRGLEESAGELIKERQLAIHMDMAVYRADYLNSKLHGESFVAWGQERKKETIDEIDHIILRGINSPSFDSFKELARSNGIPVSTLEYRLKRLEQKQIILCYRNIIRAVKLGVHRFWVTIRTTEASDALTNKFFKFCQDNSHIRYATKALGPWDFDLGFDAPSAPAGLEIRQTISDSLGDKVVQMTTINVFQSYRVCNYPFLNNPFSNGEQADAIKMARQTGRRSLQ